MKQILLLLIIVTGVAQSMSLTQNETIGLLYKVYDLIGREVQSGKVDVYFYRDLPKVGVMIVKVNGYVAFKQFR